MRFRPAIRELRAVDAAAEQLDRQGAFELTYRKLCDEGTSQCSQFVRSCPPVVLPSPEMYTNDQIQRVLLEGHFLSTNAELCEKWGVTQYRLRKWRKAVRDSYRWTLEDCLIAAIYRGGWHEPADFVNYLDWRNHALYSPDEIDDMFRNLLAWGEVEADGGRYRYVQLEPPYVFGPREGVLSVERLFADPAGRVETFLAQSPSTTMFLRSNLRAAGMSQQPSERYEGAYFAVRDHHGAIVGVVGHFWNGMLLMQSEPTSVARAARAAVRLTGLPVTGMSGELTQVEHLASELGLADWPRQLDAPEVLYELNLDELVVPPTLERGDVMCRDPRDEEFDTLVAWRKAYLVESVNDTTSDPTESVRRSVAERTIRVLDADNEIVAMTAFNATLPDVVQVGGVWTPPELRGAGYGRAVVAGHLLDARAEGVSKAILFTAYDNLPAQRAYEALGFRRIGEYGLLLFSEARAPDKL